MNSGWIGVDLDGTLAHYDGWQGPEHIGEPIGPMVERVKGWLADNQEVRIFTARVYAPALTGSHVHNHRDYLTALDRVAQADVARKAIEDWCEGIFGRRLRVTCVKDFAMTELWDDRAMRVTPNTGIPCCEHDKTQLTL